MRFRNEDRDQQRTIGFQDTPYFFQHAQGSMTCSSISSISPHRKSNPERERLGVRLDVRTLGNREVRVSTFRRVTLNIKETSLARPVSRAGRAPTIDREALPHGENGSHPRNDVAAKIRDCPPANLRRGKFARENTLALQRLEHNLRRHSCVSLHSFAAKPYFIHRAFLQRQTSGSCVPWLEHGNENPGPRFRRG